MRPKFSEAAIIVIGLVVFLALCLYQIALPGLHYDEAREAGLPAMQLVLGQPVEVFRGAGLRLFGQPLPLMVQDYIGALNVYLAMPFLALLGVSVPALRLMPVLFAALTLLFTYIFARQLFNRRVAAIAYLLLALNPSFVFWNRQGIFVTSITATLAMASLVCALRWYRRGGELYLYLGAFVLGLGLYAKLLFIWFILALIAAFILLDTRRLLSRRHLGRRQMALAILCFASGLSPVVVYNLQTGATFSTLASNLTVSYYGTENLAFFRNLGDRLNQFRVVLEGGHLWYLGGVFADRLWPYFFYGGFLAVVLIAHLKARDERWRAFFPYLVILFIIVASCFTVSALWFTHYALLIPWPPLAVAGALDILARRGGLGRLGPVVALGAATVLGLADLRVDWQYHHTLGQSGGLAAHSAASYELAAYLREHNLTAPLAMDWGIAAPVQFLTRGQVRPIEVFGYNDIWEPDESFGPRLAAFLPNPDSVYIFHSPAETVYHRRQAFEQLVADMNKVSLVETTIYRGEGNRQPIFILLRVEDQP